MMIRFPQIETWSGSPEQVSFPADVDGRRIPCRISWEALHDSFGARTMEPLEAFRQHRSAIETIAERLINRKRFEEDGSIFIRSEDCTPR